MNQSLRLEEIWEHFDTALVEDDAFLRLGRRSENPTLRAVLFSFPDLPGDSLSVRVPTSPSNGS